MNELQQAQLTILKEFDRVCAAHDIPYSLSNGTALGAVRHKGFIPWDDDVDVVMMRNDFVRLEAVWESEANPNFFLQTYRSDPCYYQTFPKVRDSRTTLIETFAVETNKMNMNHGIFIDIFLWDYVPKNKMSRLWQLFCAEMLWYLARKGTLIGLRSKLRTFIGIFFGLLFPGRLRMSGIKFLEKQVSKYRPEQSIGLAETYIAVACSRMLFPRDMLRNLEKADFEGESFLLTKDYDECLRILYGDYMTLPPMERRSTGHSYAVIDTKRPYTEVLKDFPAQ